MGRKSRLKKERKQRGFEGELMRHPMREEIRAFLKKRRVAMDKAYGLLYVVSLMSRFLISPYIRMGGQGPVNRPEEEKADETRMSRLGRILDFECGQLHIVFQEVVDELVYPMAGNKALVEPVLEKIYGMLDSLILTEGFREGSEREIQNPEFWGDFLTSYEGREEEYFEAVKDLFAFILSIAKPGSDMDLEKISHEKELEGIRSKYAIEADDFQKLRRRATEFFRIAFATYLGMAFEPLRQEVDQKICEPVSDSRPQESEGK
jgi:hypothetical protein